MKRCSLCGGGEYDSLPDTFLGERRRSRDRATKEKKHLPWRTISMKAAIVLWENWREQVKQLLAGLHCHQQKTLALCAGYLALGQGAATTHERTRAATRQHRGQGA